MSKGLNFMEKVARSELTVKLGDVLVSPNMTATVTDLEWKPSHNMIVVHMNTDKKIGSRCLTALIKAGRINIK